MTKKEMKKIEEMENKIVQLAELKSMAKKLKKDIDKLQEDILDNYEITKPIKTNYGTISLQERVTYSPIVNATLIKEGVLTEDEIFTYAKISATDLKKVIGLNLFTDLVSDGIISISKISESLVLK